MTPAPPPNTVKDKDAWREVHHLDEHGRDLSQWEIDFIENIKRRLLGGNRLTDNQRRTLDRLTQDRL